MYEKICNGRRVGALFFYRSQVQGAGLGTAFGWRMARSGNREGEFGNVMNSELPRYLTLSHPLSGAEPMSCASKQFAYDLGFFSLNHFQVRYGLAFEVCIPEHLHQQAGAILGE